MQKNYKILTSTLRKSLNKCRIKEKFPTQLNKDINVKLTANAQSFPTFCKPMDCSPPGFSVHGILQAIILECVAIPFPRKSSWPRDQIQVSCIAGRFFNIWATREAQLTSYLMVNDWCFFPEIRNKQSIFIFFPLIFISWRLITLQYCSGFYHTWTWICFF